jgi:hypothetical protein
MSAAVGDTQRGTVAPGPQGPGPSSPAPPHPPTARAALWSTLLPPFQILLFGLTIILLVVIARYAVPIDLTGLWGVLTGPQSGGGNTTGVSPGVSIILGGLVFLVGLGLIAFLWWLASRFFGLVAGGTVSSDSLSGLKDLPFALPEGTIRAFLALIVAIVGLPILLFSNSLGLDPAIGGYINGIITGVFAFYFGTRAASGTVPATAVRTIADAQNRADQADKARVQAEAIAQTSGIEADQVTRASRFDTALDRLTRHAGLATAIVQTIGPALPAGVLPPGLFDKLRTAANSAQQVLDGLKGVEKTAVSEDQLQKLTVAAGDLIGTFGGNTSVLGSLLTKAAPMLGGLAIPGLGPVAGLAYLLSMGVRLGSAEFQRWRARVLAAPVANGLVEFGTVTPQDAEAALMQTDRFRTALAPLEGTPGLGTELADKVLRDDALDRLWRLWGSDSQDGPHLFATQKDLEDGLSEYRQVLLAARAANDIPESLPKAIGAVLTSPDKPASPLFPPGTPAALTPTQAEQLVATASKASLSRLAGTPQDDQAAFDALITLVGIARRDRIDLASTLREAA